MSLAAQLLEATVKADKISSSEASKVNAALDRKGFGGKVRFRSVGEALNVAAGVLSKFELEWGQINSAHLFQADAGHQSIQLARQTSDPFSPVEIANRALGFQWSKLGEGRYEVIAYLG